MSEGGGSSPEIDPISQATEQRKRERLQRVRQEVVDKLKVTKPGEPLRDAFIDFVASTKAEAALLEDETLREHRPRFGRVEVLSEDDPYRIAYEKTVLPIESKINTRIKEDDGYRRAHQEEGLGGVDEYKSCVSSMNIKDVDFMREFARGLQGIQEEIESEGQPPTPPQK